MTVSPQGSPASNGPASGGPASGAPESKGPASGAPESGVAASPGPASKVPGSRHTPSPHTNPLAHWSSRMHAYWTPLPMTSHVHAPRTPIQASAAIRTHGSLQARGEVGDFGGAQLAVEQLLHGGDTVEVLVGEGTHPARIDAAQVVRAPRRVDARARRRRIERGRRRFGGLGPVDVE